MVSTIRKKSIVVGVLLVFSIVVGVLSIDTVIDTPNNLTDVSIHTNAILIRALMHFILAIIYASIPIILYSLFKKVNANLAIGFLAFRIIAVTFMFMGWLSILLLLGLSKEFVTLNNSDLLYFQTLDNLLRLARNLINHIAMPLILSVGNILFYYILYQSKLVARWLSVSGIIVTLLSCVVASSLLMFNIIDIITPIYVTLTFPTALLEIVLAIWLITKGFNPNYLSSLDMLTKQSITKS
ncbi:DUF4386 domain-containing protein [Aquimarina longa]|uniref:DUF4386 domain-containing protein n=1 Tax=Aquimarina longa TaxID=1080221 RepID=UPI0007813E9F|nr:DUF4386 domain-containing protein [Aquimarina longa]